jgi:hypothetical protein
MTDVHVKLNFHRDAFQLICPPMDIDKSYGQLTLEKLSRNLGFHLLYGGLSLTKEKEVANLITEQEYLFVGGPANGHSYTVPSNVVEWRVPVASQSIDFGIRPSELPPYASFTTARYVQYRVPGIHGIVIFVFTGYNKSVPYYGDVVYYSGQMYEVTSLPGTDVTARRRGGQIFLTVAHTALVYDDVNDRWLPVAGAKITFGGTWEETASNARMTQVSGRFSSIVREDVRKLLRKASSRSWIYDEHLRPTAIKLYEEYLRNNS